MAVMSSRLPTLPTPCTVIGTVTLPAEPLSLPRAPVSWLPQASTSPLKLSPSSSRRARACSHPAATATMFERKSSQSSSGSPTSHTGTGTLELASLLSPLPSLPYSLSPQATTVPSSSRASEKSRPAETCSTPVRYEVQGAVSPTAQTCAGATRGMVSPVPS